jgi:hypothetical protein
MAKAMEPGTLSSARRVYYGFSGRTRNWGQTYDPWVELGAMFSGARVETLDLEQALRFKAKNFGSTFRDATAIFSQAAVRPGSVPASELGAAYRRSAEARQAAVEDMHKVIEDAIALGLKRSTVHRVLDEASVGKRNTADIMRGLATPYAPSDRVLEGADLYQRGRRREVERASREGAAEMRRMQSEEARAGR